MTVTPSMTVTASIYGSHRIAIDLVSDGGDTSAQMDRAAREAFQDQETLLEEVDVTIYDTVVGGVVLDEGWYQRPHECLTARERRCCSQCGECDSEDS